MKIKLIYSFLLLSLTINAQTYIEDFENPVFPPPGWMVLDNGIGLERSWVSDLSHFAVSQPYEGQLGAYVRSEDVAEGIPEDWLVSPLLTAGEEISFFSKSMLWFNQNSIHRLMITDGDPTDLTSYTLVQEWTELEIDPEQSNTYTQQIVTIPEAYVGQQVHFAFVLVGDNVDGWVVDYITMDSCFIPENLNLYNTTNPTELLATWEVYPETATQWEIYITTADEPFTGEEEGIITNSNIYTFTDLAEGEIYELYVRSVCGEDIVSNWAGPAFNVDNNTITGSVMYDDDGDGNCESTNFVSLINLEITVNDVTYTTQTNQQGEYILHDIPDGENTITIQPILPESAPNITPVSQLVNLGGGNFSETIDVCIPQQEGLINDIEVTFLPVGVAQPGFYPQYSLLVKNNGILHAENVTVIIDFNSERVEMYDTVNPYTALDDDTIVINLPNIPPFGSNSSTVQFYAFEPPINMGDELLTYIAYAGMETTDDYPVNNYFTLNQTFVNSYDPNNVVVAEGAVIELIDEIKYVHYTINFQNLGTAPAVNIRIENELDANFNWDTFEMITSSHNFSVTRTDAQLEFEFADINLASSQVDEPNSHGYVIYKVKPIETIAEGDIVHNTADIYFDFNAAITTNTATSEFYSVLLNSEQPQHTQNVLLYPNPVKNNLHIDIKNDEVINVIIYDVNGRICLSSKSTTINTSALKTGFYFAVVTTNSGKATYKVIKQ